MVKKYSELIKVVKIVDSVMQRPYFPQKNVIGLVSALSEVSREEILGNCRKREAVLGRMAVQYLLVKRFGRAYTTAAELTGAKNHSGAVINVATMQSYMDWVHERYPVK